VADKKSVARLIGNAVPPKLAEALAFSIRDELSSAESVKLRIVA
jgi:site-specific DNA-cytosine methylase